ncbi:MAG: hypothetical protein SGILL_002235 [Bacillariaceae sp.]
MPWFWGSKTQDEEEASEDEEEEDEYDSNEEEYESDDESDVSSTTSSHHENDDKQLENGRGRQQSSPTYKNGDNNQDDTAAPRPDISLTTDDGGDAMSSTDDDISMIDDSSGVESLSDDLFESSSEEAEEAEEIQQQSHQSSAPPQSGDETTDDEDDDGVPTSFWEKQSLLILAAEHDRVDILKGILTEQDADKDRLMNSGIPPLHLSITFGSVHATVALLRMGADPSVRPIVHDILERQQEQPEDSKVEIPSIQRFDGASAWELAFGSQSYQDAKKNKKSWSLFGTSDSTLDSANNHHASDNPSRPSGPVIKPVDMPPSKREGVRHAFTAEALRSVGGDEVERLAQLLHSGMPATIDIGGKDLYGWAVEMGALECEELLRPSEAAKYGEGEEDNNSVMEQNGDSESNPSSTVSQEKRSSSFIIHRPTQETVPEMKNRLDELESLSMALSSCLDNLAEEVSVCHGLLLMGGGATALASHVKSLKTLKEQKLEQLEEAQRECYELGREFTHLVDSAGDAGQAIARTPAHKLFNSSSLADGDFSVSSENGGEDENDIFRKSLLAQIGASENKVRKLRASIADLSEENARDMHEVERRGLEGGINLVRGLREGIRDIDYHLGEARSTKTEYRAKISMIRARLPSPPPKQHSLNSVPPKNSIPKAIESHATRQSPPAVKAAHTAEKERGKESRSIANEPQQRKMRALVQNCDVQERRIDTEPPPEKRSSSEIHDQQKTPSEKIAAGDSQAIAVIQPGNRGYFTVDLWQVILRIIGFDRAAYRRGLEVASTQPNVMIV